MDLRRLRYFLAVAEHGTMARAAVAVAMAQPTLSQQIRALENDLGSVLFDRTARGMQLTATGRLLMPHAERLIAQADAARVAVSELDRGVGGSVRIGVIHTYNTTFLPNVIRDFSKRYPEVKLLIEEATALEIEKRILAGHFDVGLAFSPPQSDEIGYTELFREHIALVTARKSPLAQQKSIEIAALNGLSFALLTQSFATRRLIEQALDRAKVSVRVQIEMNSIGALLELARQGVAPTLLADKSLIGHRDLAVVRVTRPIIRRNAALIWDVHRYQTKATRAFMDIARRVLKRDGADRTDDEGR